MMHQQFLHSWKDDAPNPDLTALANSYWIHPAYG